MDNPVVITTEEICVWAMKRFQNADKRIKALSLSVIFLSASSFLMLRRVVKLEAEITELKKKQPVEQNATEHKIPASE